MNRIRFVFIIIILTFVNVAAAACQEKTFAVTASGLYAIPVGGLKNRFLGGFGASVNLSAVYGTPRWGGSLEYLKFNRTNMEKSSLARTVTDSVNNRTESFNLPLPKLTTDMEILGASATMTYDVWQLEPFDVRAAIGFGIYRWRSARSAYYDSIKAQLSSGRTVLVSVLQVPELVQQDWSAGLNLGADIHVRVVEPVALTIGGRYKMIVGELWQTLALDLENVSAFQMIDLHAGISVDF